MARSRTLTLKANSTDVMDYFFTGMSRQMNDVQIKDLRQDADKVARIVAKDVVPSTLKRMIKRGEKISERLKDDQSKTTVVRLIRKCVLIYKKALKRDFNRTPPKHQPERETPFTTAEDIFDTQNRAPKKLPLDASLQDVMDIFFFKQHQNLQNIKLKDLRHNQSKVIRLIVKHVSGEGIKRLYRAALRNGKRLSNKRARTRVVKYIVPIYRGAYEYHHQKQPQFYGEIDSETGDYLDGNVEMPPTPPPEPDEPPFDIMAVTTAAYQWFESLHPQMSKALKGKNDEDEIIYAIAELPGLTEMAVANHMVEGGNRRGEISRTAPKENQEFLNNVYSGFLQQLEAVIGLLKNKQRKNGSDEILSKLLPKLPSNISLSQDPITFAREFKRKNRTFKAQFAVFEKYSNIVETFNTIEQLFGNLNTALRESNMAKLSARSVLSKYMSKSEASALMRDTERMQEFVMDLREGAEKLSDVIRQNNPRKRFPAGLTFTPTGIHRYFFAGHVKGAGQVYTINWFKTSKAHYDKGVGDYRDQVKEDVVRRFQGEAIKLLSQLSKAKIPLTTEIPQYLKDIVEFFNNVLIRPSTTREQLKDEPIIKSPPSIPGGQTRRNDPRWTPPSEDLYVVPTSMDEILGERYERNILRFRPDDFTIDELMRKMNPSKARGKWVITYLARWIVRHRNVSPKDRKFLDGITPQKTKKLRFNERAQILAKAKEMIERYYNEPQSKDIAPPNPGRYSNLLPANEKARFRRIVSEVYRAIQACDLPNAAEALSGDLVFRKPRKDVKHRVLAHYAVMDDQVVVKAFPANHSLGKETRIYNNLIHELGHRYHQLVMDRERWVQWLGYEKTIRKKEKYWPGKEVVVQAYIPWTIGDEDPKQVNRKGIVQEVTKEGVTVLMRSPETGREVEKFYRRFQLDNLRSLSNEAYPSEYARQDPVELFAETWTAYITNKLSARLRGYFTHIVRDGLPLSEIKIANETQMDEEGLIVDPAAFENPYVFVDAEEDQIIHPKDVIATLARNGFIFDGIEATPEFYILAGLSPTEDEEVSALINATFPTLTFVRNGKGQATIEGI